MKELEIRAAGHPPAPPAPFTPHPKGATATREELEHTTDPALLASAAIVLAERGDLELSRYYAERARSINRNLLEVRAAFAALGKLLDARDRAANNPFALLPQQMNASYRANQLDQAESQAKELLSLVAPNAGHRNYGTSIFEAHILLGKVAFRKGDMEAAKHHLIQASLTPGSDWLASHPVPMDLARALTDAGERKAVAAFLERCSRFSYAKDQLIDWAILIRKGINPDLVPYTSSCGVAPC